MAGSERGSKRLSWKVEEVAQPTAYLRVKGAGQEWGRTHLSLCRTSGGQVWAKSHFSTLILESHSNYLDLSNKAYGLLWWLSDK